MENHKIIRSLLILRIAKLKPKLKEILSLYLQELFEIKKPNVFLKICVFSKKFNRN